MRRRFYSASSALVLQSWKVIPAFPIPFVIASLIAWFVFCGRAFGASLNFAGVPVTPGVTVQVSVPLSDLEKSYVAEGGNLVPPYTVATLVVPHGFDPNKTWPV